MSDGEVPEGRCGFVLEPGDVNMDMADKYDEGSDKWYEDSEAVCCWREGWDEATDGRCVWHAETNNKSADMLIEARADEPERLDGAFLPAVEVGDAIDFDDCRLWAATFDGTDLQKASFVRVDGSVVQFIHADLREAQFSNADLMFAQFIHTDLGGARFPDTTLPGAQFPNADLWDVQFPHSNLEAARFPHAVLWEAQFSDANLKKAQFPQADLWDARFTDANLRHARFPNADLNRTQFPDANLRRARFPDASLRRAQFANADLSYTQFSDAILEGAKFPDASLSGANFANAHLGGAEFQDATLTGVQFSASLLDLAQLPGTSLLGANFTNASLHGTRFFDADLTEANLSDTDAVLARFSGAVLEDATFTNADLAAADLTDARLHDAHLQNVRINARTVSGDVVPEEADADWFAATDLSPLNRLRWWLIWWRADPDTLEAHHKQLDRAHTVYRTIQRLYRENSMPEEIDEYHVRAKDVRRKQAIIDSAFWRWLYLAGQRWVMRYGERPRRVVYTSLVTIGLGALLYPIPGIQPNGTNSPMTYPRLVAEWPGSLLETARVLGESVYFSTVTFTTLGYGDVAPVGWGKALATVESFVGALLMALLVYVLGRRATR